MDFSKFLSAWGMLYIFYALIFCYCFFEKEILYFYRTFLLLSTSVDIHDISAYRYFLPQYHAKNPPPPPELQALTRATNASISANLPTNPASIQKSKRKILIEDSKFLGGDIEHTHLVKGLDYALLRKKRMEMAEEEAEKEAELAKLVDAHKKASVNLQRQVLYNSPFARRVCEGAMAADPRWAKEAGVGDGTGPDNATKKPPKINRLFLPGRMAWVFDTSRKGSTNPTSITRSEIEVSTADRERANAIEKAEREGDSTNDIVIGKLIQILSYIRSGETAKLQKKRKTIEEEEMERERKMKCREERIRRESGVEEERVMDRDRDGRREKDRDSRRERDRDSRREKDRDSRRERDRDSRRDRDRDSRRDKDRSGRRDRDSRSNKRRQKSRSPTPDDRFIQEETEQVAFSGSHAIDDEAKKYSKRSNQKRAKSPDPPKSPSSDIFSDAEEYVCSTKKYKEEFKSGFVKKADAKKKYYAAVKQKQEQENDTKPHFDTTDIEASLPTAPEKLTKPPKPLCTTDDIIKQAQKMAHNKKFNLKDEDTETDIQRKQLKLPQGSLAFGQADMETYGAEYDDDDRMDDEEFFSSSAKVKSGRMNEKSYVNQQWNKVNSIIEKNKKGKWGPIHWL